MKKTLMLSIFMVATTFLVQAQSDEDEIVQYYLDKRGYDYTKLESNEGELSVKVMLDENRSQRGFIDSKDSYYSNGKAYREIVSLVYVKEAMPSQADLYTILHFNKKLERGAFEIFDIEAAYVVRYLYRIPADFTESEIMEAFYYGVMVADQLEATLNPDEDNE